MKFKEKFNAPESKVGRRNHESRRRNQENKAINHLEESRGDAACGRDEVVTTTGGALGAGCIEASQTQDQLSQRLQLPIA